jgi:basic membrane protein A
MADGFDEGLAEFGLSGEKVTPSEAEPSAEDIETVSEAGSGLVFAVTDLCGSADAWLRDGAPVDAVARKHPETRYVVFDCPGDQPNVASVSFATEQGSFLAGAAAALKSKTGVIGFIGGADVPLIWPIQAGFEAGARSVDPKIEIRSGYLSSSDSSGFDNPVAAVEAAEQMYRDGADIIYSAASRSGTPVIQAAAQLSGELRRHLWAIGGGTDHYASLPHGHPLRPYILTSMLRRYDRAAYAILEEYSRGEFTPGPRTLDLSTGAVGLAASGGFIYDIREELDDLQARIESGEIKVPTIPADKQDKAAALGITPESSG